MCWRSARSSLCSIQKPGLDPWCSLALGYPHNPITKSRALHFLSIFWVHLFVSGPLLPPESHPPASPTWEIQQPLVSSSSSCSSYLKHHSLKETSSYLPVTFPQPPECTFHNQISLANICFMSVSPTGLYAQQRLELSLFSTIVSPVPSTH